MRTTGDEQLNLELIQRLCCEHLIESGYDTLPITPFKSLNYYGNIEYRTVMYLSVLMKIDRDRLADYLGPGTLIYRPEIDRYWIIINDDKCTDNRQIAYMFSLAYAYIELHMVQPDEFIDLNDDTKAVYCFANYYMAPDIILEECNMINGIGLAHYTLLPFRHILRKEKELKHKKNGAIKRIFTVLERMLLQNFAEFISQTKEKIFK